MIDPTPVCILFSNINYITLYWTRNRLSISIAKQTFITKARYKKKGPLDICNATSTIILRSFLDVYISLTFSCGNYPVYFVIDATERRTIKGMYF